MNFVYPALFIKDPEENCYLVAFDDIAVFCSGDTVEDALLEAKKLLKEYIRLSYEEYGEVLEKPRSYEQSVEFHKNGKGFVQLVDVDLKITENKND